ncbi:unnamed protein product [Owenia fusiformis]|uniref:Uncharacterized protein n=1 Tax=Owenia fusiformis TaxID=6347 RepID=A0A8J1TBM6_OWEFU|nr:unnamed protein product [Owenia fusiformis]
MGSGERRRGRPRQLNLTTKGKLSILLLIFGSIVCFIGIMFTSVLCNFSKMNPFCIIGPILLGIGGCLAIGGIIIRIVYKNDLEVKNTTVTPHLQVQVPTNQLRMPTNQLQMPSNQLQMPNYQQQMPNNQLQEPEPTITLASDVYDKY